jgi:hypothetical protein
LEGHINGFLSAIDVKSGRLLYSTYLGGTGNDRVSGIAVAPDRTVYVAGTTDSPDWPNRHFARVGPLGATDGFVIRVDPRPKTKPFAVRIGGSGTEELAGISLDSRGDIYLAGTTNSRNFPVRGTNLRQLGGGFIMKISGRDFATRQAKVLWARRFGGHGDDALLSVSANMPNAIFVSGRSGSKDFSTTCNAIYSHLQAENDSTLIRFSAADGKLEFATFLGGTRIPASWYNDEATGVFATLDGDVFVTGCTLDDRLPVSRSALQTHSRGNSEPFVLRMKFSP